MLTVDYFQFSAYIQTSQSNMEGSGLLICYLVWLTGRDHVVFKNGWPTLNDMNEIKYNCLEQLTSRLIWFFKLSFSYFAIHVQMFNQRTDRIFLYRHFIDVKNRKGGALFLCGSVGLLLSRNYYRKSAIQIGSQALWSQKKHGYWPR